jgi:hypothetical protein
VMSIVAGLAAGPATPGELTIRREGTGFVVEGPPGEGPFETLPCHPDALRDFLKFDAEGRYRPLPGARGMRGNWRTFCPTVAHLEEALDAIYPLALRQMSRWRAGGVRPVPLEEVLGRQSGRYSVAVDLSERGRAIASDLLCGSCVRAPAWRGDDPGEDGIPCVEPCSVLVSLCREAALWEKEPPRPAAPGPSVPFAAFDMPGNAIREAYLERAFSKGASSGIS